MKLLKFMLIIIFSINIMFIMFNIVHFNNINRFIKMEEAIFNINSSLSTIQIQTASAEWLTAQISKIEEGSRFQKNTKESDIKLIKANRELKRKDE